MSAYFRVKYVSWTCDNPLISMYHESVFHDCNYIFTFDKTNYLEFREMGVKHIWYLPLAVDTERMDALLGVPEEVGRWKVAQDPERCRNGHGMCVCGKPL